MTYTCTIKFAPLTTLERINDPRWQNRTMYDPHALKFLPSKTSVPLIVDHDEDRQIGVVHDLFRFEWIDGPWLAARATVTDPPAWLKRRTAASFQFKALSRSDWRGCDIVRDAIVTEISALSPSVQPAEPLAEVLAFGPATPQRVPPKAMPAAAVRVDPAAAGLSRSPDVQRDRFLSRREADSFLALAREFPVDKLADLLRTSGERPQPDSRIGARW